MNRISTRTEVFFGVGLFLCLASGAAASRSHCVELTTRVRTGVERVSANLLTEPVKAFWTQAIVLAAETNGRPTPTQVSRLDASMFVPTVLEEIEIIRARRQVLQTAGLDEAAMSGVRAAIAEMHRLIARVSQSHVMTYGTVDRYIQLHDALMSSHGMVLQTGLLPGFPMTIGYVEPHVLNNREGNDRWNFLMTHIGRNSGSVEYDGGSQNDLGRHDVAHGTGRVAAQPPQNLFSDVGVEGYFLSMDVHWAAYRDFLMRFDAVPAVDPNTFEQEMGHLIWSQMDHEKNRVWHHILAESIRAPVFSIAPDVAVLKSRIRRFPGSPTTDSISHTHPYYLGELEKFLKPFRYTSFFGQSISNLNRRHQLQAMAYAALVPLRGRNITAEREHLLIALQANPVHGEAMGWAMRALDEWFKWLGYRIEL